MKTGTTIEKLARTKTVAFDKTGTITKGFLEVAEIHPEPAITEDDLLIYAASAEQESGHILARSLLKNVSHDQLLAVSDLKEITGQGIQALVADHQVKIGRASFVGTNEIQTTKTAIYVAIDGQFAGTILFSDTLRPEAKETIQELKKLGISDLMMITGDGQAIAESIAAEVGLTSIHARCLPQDKLKILEQIPEKDRPVTMVGDGVNDAPSLKAADIGIAMGKNGTDVAIADVGIAMGAHGSTAASESADAVILKDDLTKVTTAVMISKRTMQVAKQSVLIGIFICVFLMLVASMGVIPALFGAVLQEVVDTVSILSALRARSDR